MVEDKLGKFLFDNGVPPDDFQYFRDRALGNDIAVLETEGYKSFIMTDKRGAMVYKLMPELARLSLLQRNFSVRFMDKDKPKNSVSFHELDDDPDELELIEVEFHEPNIEEDGISKDLVAELSMSQDVSYEVHGIPIFFSYDGTLISSHPDHPERDDPGQPLLFD